MKTLVYLLFSLFTLSNQLVAQDNYRPLFKIYENGLYGYIDSTGQIIIPPKFKGAGEFSEGLAPVRENGYYGYIDETGKYVLPAVYDYGESFVKELAVVHKNGKAGLMKRTGNLQLPFKFLDIEILANGFAKVTSTNHKEGVVDNNGKMIIDTAYLKIYDFSDGIVTALGKSVYKWQSNAGAIDSTGKIIIPFGKYNSISPFYNGYSKVMWADSLGNNSKWGFINKKGDILFSMNDSAGWQPSDYVTKEGIFIVDYFDHGFQDNGLWIGKKKFCGLMNLNGELIMYDSTCNQYEFYLGELCLKDEFGRYKALNQFLEPDGNYFFIYQHRNKLYYSYRDSAGVFGLIDTSLQFTAKPFFKMPYAFSLKEDYFIFRSEEPDFENIPVSKFGICRNDGNIIIGPQLDIIDHKGFRNGLLLFKKDGKAGYLNKNGRIVWLQNSSSNKLIALNIDYQLTNSYVIGEQQLVKPVSTGKASSLPYELDEDDFLMLIDTTEKLNYLKKYNGISLYIVNNTDEMAITLSLDGSLPLVLQAKDNNGEWADIENSEADYCNTPGTLIFFAAHSFWKFVMPQYDGGFRTMLRVKMGVLDSDNNCNFVFSNVVEGKINPSQFWRKQPFAPNDILLY